MIYNIICQVIILSFSKEIKKEQMQEATHKKAVKGAKFTLNSFFCFYYSKSDSCLKQLRRLFIRYYKYILMQL